MSIERTADTFILTEQHIALLQRMHILFDEYAYDGAPTVNVKRPYGNSNVENDIHEILYGHEFDYEANNDEMPKALYEDLHQLHRETGIALQIILSNKSFQPGVYQKVNQYDQLSWRLCEKG